MRIVSLLLVGLVAPAACKPARSASDVASMPSGRDNPYSQLLSCNDVPAAKQGQIVEGYLAISLGTLAQSPTQVHGDVVRYGVRQTQMPLPTAKGVTTKAVEVFGPDKAQVVLEDASQPGNLLTVTYAGVEKASYPAAGAPGRTSFVHEGTGELRMKEAGVERTYALTCHFFGTRDAAPGPATTANQPPVSRPGAHQDAVY